MTAHSISVAMATYNGARHLERQLTSLAEQERLPLELVVNDDRSTDDTVDILRSFSGHAPFPVRIAVNPARLGWRANFMAATIRTTGDLVAFCDQDDEWYPRKLASVAPYFDDSEILLVFHDADVSNEAGRTYATLWPESQAKGRICRLSRPTSWSNPLGLTQVFRRTLTAFNDLWTHSIDHYAPPHRAAHDQWFYFLATNLGDVIAHDDRLLCYRQHGANAVGWKQEPFDRRPLREDLARSIGMLTAFSAILRQAARGDRSTCGMRERLLAAADRNEGLLDRLRLRRSLHDAPAFVDRLRVTMKLLRRRAYDQTAHWGLGRRALLVDATRGLFGGLRE